MNIAKGYGRKLSLQECRRITDFYKHHPVDEASLSESIWLPLFRAGQKPICDKLIAASDLETQSLLHHLYDISDPVCGMDGAQCETESRPTWREELMRLIVCILTRAACACGHRVFNPEQPDPGHDFDETFVGELEGCLGVNIGIVPAYGMYGLETGGRFIHHKVACALPGFMSIRRLLPNGGVVIELGSGIGHLGHLISQVESIQYHTCDLGLASALHAGFAFQNFPPSSVWLDGEQNKGARINIHGAKFPDLKSDLVVNTDSLPEIPKPVAVNYLIDIQNSLNSGGYFLSINHESLRGQTTVRSIVESQCHSLRSLYRSPCWHRDGYVEECWVKR